MIFKENGLEKEFMEIHPKLRMILFTLSGYLLHYFQKDVMITSLIRKEDKGSVHYWGRGADVRAHDLSDGAREMIEEWLNKMFIYGKNGIETCYLHGEGANSHFHLQVIGGQDLED